MYCDWKIEIIGEIKGWEEENQVWGVEYKKESIAREELHVITRRDVIISALDMLYRPTHVSLFGFYMKKLNK